MKYFKKNCYSWIAWLIPACCFLVMYIARVAPAAFLDQLMVDFNVSHGTLGALGSAFLQGYVLMQIPVGLLVDRFGPVKLLIISSILSIAGNSFFAASETLAQAHAARMLLGVGSAFIFISAFKQAKIWLPAQYFPLAAGLTQVLGMLGGAIGNSLVHDPSVSWRVTVNIITQVWCVLVVLMFIFLRSKKENEQEASHSHGLKEMFTGLKMVVCNSELWRNGLYAGLIFMPTEVLGGWWGPYYLTLIHGISTVQAGGLIGSIFVGWAIGGSVIGYIAGKWNCTKELMIASAVFSLLFLGIGLYGRGCPLYVLHIAFFLFGISNTGLVLAYALSTNFLGIEVAGSAVAFTNILSIILGLVMQPMIGHSVNFMQSHVSELQAFDAVMFLLPLGLFISACIAVRLRLPKDIAV